MYCFSMYEYDNLFNAALLILIYFSTFMDFYCVLDLLFFSHLAFISLFLEAKIPLQLIFLPMSNPCKAYSFVAIDLQFYTVPNKS